MHKVLFRSYNFNYVFCINNRVCKYQVVRVAVVRVGCCVGNDRFATMWMPEVVVQPCRLLLLIRLPLMVTCNIAFLSTNKTPPYSLRMLLAQPYNLFTVYIILHFVNFTTYFLWAILIDECNWQSENISRLPFYHPTIFLLLRYKMEMSESAYFKTDVNSEVGDVDETYYEMSNLTAPYTPVSLLEEYHIWSSNTLVFEQMKWVIVYGLKFDHFGYVSRTCENIR